MSDDHIQALKDALSQRLLGTPYDPNSHYPESALIRHLAAAVCACDAGETGANAMRAAFAANPIPGFDFNLWLFDRIEDGTYDSSVLEDDPDE